MASSDRNKTKYTYKGNNKKADNKYANIYQDLNEKEELYKSNLLIKLHESDDDSNLDSQGISKMSITTISAEEAEINAKKRRQAAKNQMRIATGKSSPVIENSNIGELSKEESFEILKKEKMASKNSGVEDDGLKLQNTNIFSISEENGDNFSGDYISEMDYIRQKARERAQMDKSDVKIYKEYSDFDKPENVKKDKKENNGNKEEISVFKIEKNLKENTLKNNSGYIDDKTARFEIEKNIEDVKVREKEIEKILKLKDEKFGGEEKKNSGKRERRNTPEKEIREKQSRRSKSYRKNPKKSYRKINFKKIIMVIICILLVVLGISAALDKVKTYKMNEKQNMSASQNANKKIETKKESKKESIEEKKSKLEGIKGTLNADESKRLDYIVENITSYPEILIDRLIKNPETVDYVYSYKDRDKYNSKPLEHGISSSYFVDGNVPLFLQWDRRWGYRNYGKEMIGLSGCGPTSLAMVIKHFDKSADVNPYTVAKFSEENGYVSKDNFTSWKLFEVGLKKYGLESRDIVPVEAKMKRALDNGQILIASVKPGIFTQRGHIIIIKGYNSKGDFLINDPNSIINTNKTWSFDELKDEIRKIWGVSEIGSTNNSESDELSSDKKNEKEQMDTSRGSSDDPSIIQDIE